jgi:histidinol-phosphate aminotransferase
MEINLYDLVRENVLKLKPYSSARDEHTDVADIYLDANENPFNWAYNRYPDPYQRTLKNAISQWKKVKAEHIFLGNGSDEIIDLMIRAFCEPQINSIVTIHPSYGMYTVSADINDVEVRYFPLDANFTFETDTLIRYLKPEDKILFLCSPNNPSGNCIDPAIILQICKSFQGLVVVDEAYIDFADTESMLSYVDKIPNLIVMQTLSKAIGGAGIRLGMAFMDPFIVGVLNKIKPPYNINSATQNIALERISDQTLIDAQIKNIKHGRSTLNTCLESLSFVQKVFPSEANFILAKVDDADDLYDFLIHQSIVVRNRNKQYRCEGCLRFTIGTPAEMDSLIKALHAYQKP